MTKDEALDLALEFIEANHFGGPDAFELISAIKQARALDKKAENARELGLDYEPAGGTQVSKVWWDGEKLMAKPIPLVEFYKAAPTAQPSPVQDPVWIQPDHLQKAQKAPFLCRVEPHKRDDFVPLYTTPPAAPVQEPNYWDVIDPAGNIVASETDAIRGWARIAGSYKPTVEGLLGFHDQGWRVLPKVTPPAAQRQWVGLTDNEIALIHADYPHPQGFARAIEAKLKEKNGM